MTGTVFVKSYEAPEWDRREILRYASAGEGNAEVMALLEECIAESAPKLCYKVCYARFPVKHEGVELDLGFACTGSKNLQKNLSSCREIVLFAATVGLGIDRLIARNSHISPAKALMFDAIGSERVEALCDVFNSEMMVEAVWRGGFTRPRFSPGYGDLPLELQRDIFRVLSPEKNIGAVLNDSLLISPTKSVTAIIGISL
ncbi:MAG: Vitamin B12 dependent methionine synthase activation subunit [Clostridia bacterium]|nr:Vitamin B12 dependent methionine synthase activation subunit [Clostridia bacterium]